MKDWYVFHKTVRGHLHILKEIPCEDFSASCQAEDGSYRIIAVADGHGDPACARSAFGSRAVAETAVDCLQQFARELTAPLQEGGPDYAAQLRIPGYQKLLMKQLSDSILSRWYGKVHQDLEENPVREEELEKCSEYYKAEYQAGRHLEHIYGTTLIAGLMTDAFLILLHQGDGRCDVFYEDGTVEQPIPWDDRCFENVTTSICDEDAPESVRHCVIDLAVRPVAACYMGSDGVEDSYRDMEGTHSFYRELSCDLLEKAPEEFDAYLEESLPIFSRSGSGDDVSVAGIVNREAVRNLAPRFRELNRSYQLSEKVLACQGKLTSMERKHGILRRRADEAKKAWEEQENGPKQAGERLAALEREEEELKARISTVAEDLNQRRQEAEELKSELGSALGQGRENQDGESQEREGRDMLGRVKSFVPEISQILNERIMQSTGGKEKELGRLTARLEALQKQLEEQRRDLAQQAGQAESLKTAWEEAEAAFREYDETYRRIAEEKRMAEEEIAAIG